MNKLAPFVLAVSIGSLLTGGCSAPVSDDNEDESAVAESDLTSSDLIGEYEPYSTINHEFDNISSVTVVRDGSRLRVDVTVLGSLHKLATSRSASGAYLFSSGLIEDDCDNPTCSYLESFTGLVYFKKVDGKKIPTVKFSTLTFYPHPESDEDKEGYVTETFRWRKIESKP